ncbi:hypothetical protein [Streptomyces sp. NPDC048224]
MTVDDEADPVTVKLGVRGLHHQIEAGPACPAQLEALQELGIDWAV